MTSSLLNLSARTQAHSHQSQQLGTLCKGFQGWDYLLCQAEDQGMGPLLHMHLSDFQKEVPQMFFCSLKFLRLRHQQANSILMKSLKQILYLLETHGIPCLVLKGAALCQTLYPDIGLRPMRDIDLLLSKGDVEYAHSLLKKEGFFTTSDKQPDGHFHLPPLFQNIGGLRICVELHHGLFPNDPPYYQQLNFSVLYQNKLAFQIDGTQAYTLADEEMLWHVFQHGFRAPLTYEPFRLISVADIVSLVEARVDKIDWQKIKTLYPQIINALPLFHYITPWNDTLLSKNLFKKKKVPSRIGVPYSGWPRKKFDEIKDHNIQENLQQTFFPGQWWLMLYYSIDGRLYSSIWCRLVKHPLHILRWVKIYSTVFLKEKARLWGV